MTATPHESVGEVQASLRGQVRSAVEAELARLLTAVRELGKVTPEFREPLAEVEVSTAEERPLGRARKVSVSLPEELTAAVQQRVGRGEFSQYVAEAVARQLELDLLHELAEMLEAEHGPVPAELVAEAGAAWPDAR
ncbi:Arc/MetJ-type ribon-helix-helix transcriptional regulator [Crossiella equi]|uniref:Arc/MetJ-type ribon-helix-helix transcriptional regulator n=1 Tax=Crossiella equi TaxID=130796 RepID=A0ABS5AEW6_9PSEU|nr:hypothetical protein [Crossiella equi]MBP2475125.1 Arc/MetJ-type ribon-helix-helix transcriptional regulator [Crossiella equi]